MKKYVVNISGTSNILGDPKFFIGTGFMGAGFDTHEELKDLRPIYPDNNDFTTFLYTEIRKVHIY